MDGRFPAIAKAAAGLEAQSFTIDEEAVVCGPDGLSRFDDLRQWDGGQRAMLWAFDLIEHEGADLRSMPFLERKGRLARLLRPSTGGILLNEHIEADGAIVFEHPSRPPASHRSGFIFRKSSHYCGHGLGTKEGLG